MEVRIRVSQLQIGSTYYVDKYSNSYGTLEGFDDQDDPYFNMIENEGGYGIDSEGFAPFLKDVSVFYKKKD